MCDFVYRNMLLAKLALHWLVKAYPVIFELHSGHDLEPRSL